MIEPIKIEGLKEFSRALRKVDSNLPKALRISNNEAVDVVIDWARPKVPVRSGNAVKSMKAKSTRTSARAAIGSSAAPYAPWLDFGGRVGINKSVQRPFLKEGRYLYPGLHANRAKVMEILERSLLDIANEAGLAVDHG